MLLTLRVPESCRWPRLRSELARLVDADPNALLKLLGVPSEDHLKGLPKQYNGWFWLWHALTTAYASAQSPPLLVAWSEDPAEEDYPALPTGFHGQKFTAAVKAHLHKTRPSRVLVPPATKQRLPPAPQPIIEIDSPDQGAADRALADAPSRPGLGPAAAPANTGPRSQGLLPRARA